MRILYAILPALLGFEIYTCTETTFIWTPTGLVYGTKQEADTAAQETFGYDPYWPVNRPPIQA
jgi:hypothetical protein